jgi:hypothetical protein
MTLMPGDIIATGTPPGVGMGMQPPVFLKKGDVMTLGIEGLGEQRQVVMPPRPQWPAWFAAPYASPAPPPHSGALQRGRAVQWRIQAVQTWASAKIKARVK